MNKKTKKIFTTAAMAGILSGASLTVISCSGSSDKTGVESPSTAGKHACKGMNACKGQGGCKTAENECKGMNSCKAKGGCKTDK